MWVDGEWNGRSEMGDNDSDEDRDDGKDGRDEFAGVDVICEGVIVSDRSQTLVIETNCP